MSNDTLYSTLFKGLKFKKVPQVPEVLREAMNSITDDKWIRDRRDRLKQFAESHAFAELLSYAFKDRQLGDIKIECLTSRAASIRYQGKVLEFLVDPRKASKSEVIDATSLKLLDISDWPLMPSISQVNSLDQSVMSIPTGSVAETIVANEPDQHEMSEEITPSIKQSLFAEFESDNSEEKMEKIKEPLNLNFAKEDRKTPEVVAGGNNASSPPSKPQNESIFPMSNEFHTKTPTPLEQMGSGNRALSTNEVTRNEGIMSSGIKQTSSNIFQLMSTDLNPKSSLYTNTMFKEDLSNSAMSSPTPRKMADSINEADIDNSLEKINEDAKVWRPAEELTITNFFENLFYKEEVKKGNIDTVRPEQTYKVNQDVDIDMIQGGWLNSNLFKFIKKSLKEKNLDLSIFQRASKNVSKEFIHFIVRNKEGEILIKDLQRVSSSLPSNKIHKLALYNFLKCYFPLIAANIAKNTLVSLAKHDRHTQSISGIETSVSHLGSKEPESLLAKKFVGGDFDKVDNCPKSSVSKSSPYGLKSMRDTYTKDNEHLMRPIDIKKVKCTVNNTPAALEANFGYELAHTPSADILKCACFEGYLKYKKELTLAMKSSTVSQMVKDSLKAAKNVTEACDAITIPIFKEFLVMQVHRENSITYFISSTKPRPICQIELKIKAKLEPATLLGYGCMIFMRLIAKDSYSRMKELWSDQTSFFV